ncbi:NADPH-dependent FMN reductase [Streptomyces sp. NBC_00257]|uniref:NADPH-dependent FMN reductase n=1 Tax=Streptomyces sp. NBC_00257 TaxID=2975692 RepID=UPI003FA71144
MPNIAIILASARPGCAGAAVAHWVLTQAEKRTDATFDLIDLAEVDLPQIDEAMPPALGRYTDPHTQQWADIIADFDGYVIVTPEYNHSFPGVLKNALDRVYAEWNNKAVGLVSYGVDGGVRAVEALRLVLKRPSARRRVGTGHLEHAHRLRRLVHPRRTSRFRPDHHA